MRPVFVPFLVLAFALPLAACGSAEDPANEAAADSGGDSSAGVSMAEAAKMAEAEGVKPQPGEYRSTVEIVEFSVPNAPPELKDMMRQSMTTQTSTFCLKEEDVKDGFQEMVRKAGEGDNCAFERYEVDGGRIDARMVCDVPQRGKMTMTLTGQGTETRSDMDMTMEGDMPGLGAMTMRMKSTQERIGACS